jgi:hypothetical protein
VLGRVTTEDEEENLFVRATWKPCHSDTRSTHPTEVFIPVNDWKSQPPCFVSLSIKTQSLTSPLEPELS